MNDSVNRFSLDGKVAIVTGAGGRGNSIGRAYACGLASAGAKLVVADLNLSGAEAVATEIVEEGGKALAIGVDIADPTSAQAMAAFAKERFGGVDILVNNAGLMAELTLTPAIQTPIDEWNKIMAVNLTGALNCSQAVVPLMQERGGGKIVNQASAGAYPANTVYGISKLALVGLTQTLARELGPAGINVNAIAPGHTMTDAGKALPSNEQFEEMINMIVAMRGKGLPDELVGALLLLCSDAGSWMTGQVLHVDGGLVLR